jgi:hypothetical protein
MTYLSFSQYVLFRYPYPSYLLEKRAVNREITALRIRECLAYTRLKTAGKEVVFGLKD